MDESRTGAMDAAHNHDERMVAAYEVMGASIEERAQAIFAATGNAELEARVAAADLAHENGVLRTLMRARQINAGWEGGAADVAHLYRLLRKAGIVP